MPRGQRKSLEEKIQAKQELINALNIRMESEQRELEELFEQKKRKELEAVSDIIEDAGLPPERKSYSSILRAVGQMHHDRLLYFIGRTGRTGPFCCIENDRIDYL